MNIIADLHCHTIASSHAYSTVMENVAVAAEKKLKMIAITDHGVGIADSPDIMHFKNFSSIPKIINGVRVLSGVEANIMDYNGTLDMPTYILETLDWVIASMHEIHLPSTTIENHSQAWIDIAKNPHVDMIGHCGDARFPFDHERVIKVFKEYNKILEVNNHSFMVREGSKKNCAELSKLCMKYDVPILLTSDAHFCLSVGEVSESVQMLQEINFPQKLILNTDYDMLISEIKRLRGRDFSK